MYRGKRIVAFTPYGRERTSVLLSIYLAREQQRGILDEWWLCLNMDDNQRGDMVWAHNVAGHLPWVKLVKRPCAGYDDCPPKSKDEMCKQRCERYEGQPEEWCGGPRKPKQMNTGRFYWFMQDPDTIFVRFDDDIIWMHTDAITSMVDVLLDDPGNPLVVFPIIWNNAVSSYYLQLHGHLPPEWTDDDGVLHTDLRGKVRALATDKIGWESPKFAVGVHDMLLHHLEHDNPGACLTADLMWLDPQQRFSVSCFAIRGEEYCAPDIAGVLDWDEEEHWHTGHRTGTLGRRNVVTGMAQVSHYTFFTQSDYIRQKRPDILNRYWVLAEKVKADIDAGEFEHDRGRDLRHPPVGA